MPDASQLEMPGSNGGGGVPGWLMVVGAVAGVVGLVVLLKGGGGGGTTAAGTSINAALGSIQEENMNLLGVTQAGFMQTNQAIASTSQQTQTEISQGFAQEAQALTSGFLNTQNQIGALGNQQAAGFTNIQGLIGTLESDITSQLTAFSSQSQSNFTTLNNLITSGQASQDQVNAAEMNLLTSIQGDVKAGLVGQQQANAMLSQTGAFLGWEFYQLPNRYSAYIPPGMNPPGWS